MPTTTPHTTRLGHTPDPSGATEPWLVPVSEPGHDTALDTRTAGSPDRGFRDQPRHDDRQRRAADARARAARLEQPSCSGSSTPTTSSSPPCCSPRAASATASGARACCSPASASSAPPARPAALRSTPGAADRRALRDGPRRGDDLPRDAVADLEHLHRPRRARAGDRPLGRDRGHRRSRSGRSSAAGCSSTSPGRASSSRWRRSRRSPPSLVARVRADLARPARAARSTAPGFALSTAAMALLVFTIIEAPDHGWSAPGTLAGFAVAAALLVGFVAWERRVARADARRQPVPQPALHAPRAAR